MNFFKSNSLILLWLTVMTTGATAAEVPLCVLPQLHTNGNHGGEDDGDNPACPQIFEDAKKIAAAKSSKLSFDNTTSIPSQLSVGAVYLQPITMMPTGMMLPRNQSDIHLEIDIHAKENLKSRGFAPGDWLPNVIVDYTIQKVGEPKPLTCSDMRVKNSKTTCQLMPMVASDGAHYGDNVKLNGPGFYKVTFYAHTTPNFGWHIDTDTKILGTEYVDWHFKQSYLFKWTGIGKLGGY